MFWKFMLICKSFGIVSGKEAGFLHATCLSKEIILVGLLVRQYCAFNFFRNLNKKLWADFHETHLFVSTDTFKRFFCWKNYQIIWLFENWASLFWLIFDDLNSTCVLENDKHVYRVTLCWLFPDNQAISENFSISRFLMKQLWVLKTDF